MKKIVLSLISVFVVLTSSLSARAETGVSTDVDIGYWQYEESLSSSALSIKANGIFLSPSLSLSADLGGDFLTGVKLTGVVPLTKGALQER